MQEAGTGSAQAAIHVVEGPAFPVAVKALATAMMVALAASGASSLAGLVDAAKLWSGEGLFLLAVLAVICSSYWGLMTSRTRFDGDLIEQTWLWTKRVKLADITQVKLIRWRGMEWIVVPRLVVRTGFGLTTFQASDPGVLAQFERLVYGE